jgi:Fe-S oxidoreductase
VLDWSEYPGGARGFQGAAEMCNNNGACRSRAGGVMCPSYRITGDERDVTRGRANTLRLALSGQLGPDALASDAMADAMSLCVSCKACRRECPTGVDMARMKIEVLAARAAKTGVGLRDRLIAELPRYAPFAARVPLLANLRDTVPGLAALSERWFGLAADRTLPRFRRDVFRTTGTDIASADVVLFADTFNRYHDRENLDAALVVLAAAGLRVHVAQPASGRRPLCCGRTYLATGLVAQARAEAQRTLDALGPAIERRLPVLGLEPSCLFTFRDEFTALGLGEPARRLKDQAQLIEEYLAAKADAGTLRLDLAPIAERALLHGHCHQKAFGALGATEHCLRLIPGLAVETVQSSCCGMAGAFGYQAETRAQSQAMAELALLPAVRKAAATTRIVADGTSCRHQIGDGTGRSAVHVVRLLAESATRERERRSV